MNLAGDAIKFFCEIIGNAVSNYTIQRQMSFRSIIAYATTKNLSNDMLRKYNSMLHLFYK